MAIKQKREPKSKEEIKMMMSPIGKRESFIRKFLSSPEAKTITLAERKELNTIRGKMEKGLMSLDDEYKEKVDKFVFDVIDEEYNFINNTIIPRIKKEIL